MAPARDYPNISWNVVTHSLHTSSKSGTVFIIGVKRFPQASLFHSLRFSEIKPAMFG